MHNATKHVLDVQCLEEKKTSHSTSIANVNNPGYSSIAAGLGEELPNNVNRYNCPLAVMAQCQYIATTYIQRLETLKNIYDNKAVLAVQKDIHQLCKALKNGIDLIRTKMKYVFVVFHRLFDDEG